jgi:hypothetical protein
MRLHARHTIIENDALPMVGEQRTTLVGLLPSLPLNSLICGEDNIGWLYCVVVPGSALTMVGTPRQPTVVNMTGHISITPYEYVREELTLELHLPYSEHCVNHQCQTSINMEVVLQLNDTMTKVERSLVPCVHHSITTLPLAVGSRSEAIRASMLNVFPRPFPSASSPPLHDGGGTFWTSLVMALIYLYVAMSVEGPCSWLTSSLSVPVDGLAHLYAEAVAAWMQSSFSP